MGVFSMANIPVICGKGYSWYSSDNIVGCTLVACVSDRKLNCVCCSFTFNKDKTVDVKWDHVTQFRRRGPNAAYAIGPYYNGRNLMSTKVSLWQPTSLN